MMSDEIRAKVDEAEPVLASAPRSATGKHLSSTWRGRAWDGRGISVDPYWLRAQIEHARDVLEAHTYTPGGTPDGRWCMGCETEVSVSDCPDILSLARAWGVRDE